MTARVLYVYLGHTTEKMEVFSNDPDEYTSFHLIDQEIAEIDVEKTSQRIVTIDINDSTYIQELLLNQMPFQHIVIYPVLQPLSHVQSERYLKQILDKMFLFIKILYLPVMRYKNTKIWFIDTASLYLPLHPMKNENFLKLFQAGLMMFTKVTAMELAKKMINVNLIQIEESDFFLGLQTILIWTLHNKLYLTAEKLRI